MANGINMLIAQGRPAPTFDWMESKKNALLLQKGEQELAAYPEEQEWKRTQRNMLQEKFGMEKTKFQQEQEERPFKTADEAWDHVEKWGHLTTYQNYPDTRQRWINRGISPDLLPPREFFDAKAADLTGGVADPKLAAEYFKLWRDDGLKSLKTKREEAKADIDKRKVGVLEREVAVKEELAKRPKEGKTPPSAGNAVDLAIKRKFGTDYLSDPNKAKVADEWLATTEGRQAVVQARDDLGQPAITFLQTSEGYAPAITKGPGLGTVGEPTGVKKPLPVEQAAKIGEIEALLNNVSETRRLYDPKYVGVIAGRTGRIEEKYLGSASKDQVKFYSYVRDMQDSLLRARSGAQINEQEYKRLVSFLPEVNLPSKSFEARLDRFEEQLRNILGTKRRALSEGGYGGKFSKPGTEIDFRKKYNY